MKGEQAVIGEYVRIHPYRIGPHHGYFKVLDRRKDLTLIKGKSLPYSGGCLTCTVTKGNCPWGKVHEGKKGYICIRFLLCGPDIEKVPKLLGIIMVGE